MAGINVFVHWTFSLLLVWILSAHLLAGQALGTASVGVVLICGLFACVVLHELGHALTARRFGIDTIDITLLPIGGLARLERMPEEPRQELLIAIAGPLVNIVIAAMLACVLIALGSQIHPASAVVIGGSLLTQLMWMNLSLAVFNFLPAFPMDGGRMLRALLAYRLPYLEATRIAVTIGRVMAVLFGIVGAFAGNWILVLIAVFVFLAGSQETAIVQARTLTNGVPVRDAMSRTFHNLHPAHFVEHAAELLHRGYYDDFPVVRDGAVVGILLQRDLLQAIRLQELNVQVADLMHEGCPVVREDDLLSDAVVRMKQCGCATVAVVRDGKIVGMLSDEHLDKWMTIQAALREPQSNVEPYVATPIETRT